MVMNLNASVNLPKNLANMGANSNEDFDHYAIYRATNEIFPMTKIATTMDVAYEDLVNDNGVNYYYKVTAVDKDGLESPRQNAPVVGSTLSAPKEPVFNYARFNDSAIELSWNISSDSRAVKYKITKSSKQGQDIIYDVVGQSYSDFNIQEA